jgi:hypothetical protein
MTGRVDAPARSQPVELSGVPPHGARAEARRVHRSPTSGFAAYTTEGIDLRGKITAGVSGIGSPSWN